MNYLLFTTRTCPRCPEVKAFVRDHVTFPGRVLDETAADFPDLAQRHGVQQAPTLVVLDGEREVFRGNEADEIAFWLQSLDAPRNS